MYVYVYMYIYINYIYLYRRLEWRGDWSDASPLWTAELRSELARSAYMCMYIIYICIYITCIYGRTADQAAQPMGKDRVYVYMYI